MTKVEQFEAIRRDRRLEGISIRALAKKHGVHRRTVKEALASAVPPERKVAERPSPVFGPYEETVRGGREGSPGRPWKSWPIGLTSAGWTPE